MTAVTSEEVKKTLKQNLWRCTNCAQVSRRPWNLRVHIERKHAGIGQPVRVSDLAGQQYSTSNYTMNGQNKTTPINPYAECDRIQDYTEKLVQLQNILNKYCPKEQVAQLIDICCTAFIGSRNDKLLQAYLELGRRWERFLDKVAALEQKMPNANITSIKMLKIAFVRAINKPIQVYPSPPDFRDNAQFNPHHAYISQVGKQEPWTAAKAAYIRNQDWRPDPFYLYFGESKEEFERDWLRENSSVLMKEIHNLFGPG